NKQTKNCFSMEKSEAIAFSVIKNKKGNQVEFELSRIDNLVNEYQISYTGVNEFNRPGFFWTVSVDKLTCKTRFYHGK
ncbi:MAG: hypothetical protein KDC52_18265, partial [Ignavibacteriae bacterium]|nr:hypothetical protein [Ignavibacteriota bacterium]